MNENPKGLTKQINTPKELTKCIKAPRTNQAD